MMLTNAQRHGAILLSLIIGMALRILPLPDKLIAFNPDWVLLVLVYWCTAIPERFGVGLAWLTGLVTDVLTGAALGQYALAYSVVAYLCIKLHQRLRLFPLSQQAIFVLFFALLSQILLFWSQTLQESENITWTFWLPSITGAILWSPVFLLLRKLRHELGIY